MTGISLPGSGRPSKDDTPSQRYESIKTVPERYSIIQLGLALFHEHPDYAQNKKPTTEEKGTASASSNASSEAPSAEGSEAEYLVVR